MKETMRPNLLHYAVAVTALVSLAGCIFSPPPDDPGVIIEPVANTSPVNVLKNIELAYNTGNFNLYKSCLATTYVFYFNPVDVGQPSINNPEYLIPVSWNYNQDINSTRNMFEQAYSITMGIPTATVGTPGSGEKTYRTENITITLTLMVDELNGYRIGEGYCIFEFESYIKAGEETPYWRLTRWSDFTKG